MSGSGGGVQGVRTPFLAYYEGFLTLGLKLDPLLDPPFFACRPKMGPSFEKSWIGRCCLTILLHATFTMTLCLTIIYADNYTMSENRQRATSLPSVTEITEFIQGHNYG